MSPDARTAVDKAGELLRQLVLVPSSARDDKKEVIECVLRPLEASGFSCEILGEADSPALVASKGSGGVLLSGHLDTVPLGEGWSRQQGEMQGSVLYGRGAVDMKGGCTAMILSAEKLAKTETPVSLAFSTDEEASMKGAERIARHEVVTAAPAVIVCEPTGLKIAAREKGLLQIKLTAVGRSAHAAMPREGENAVHKMLKALDRLRPMAENASDSMSSTTLNVSVMRGGEKVNVIPDSCVAEIDIRIPPESSIENALAAVRERLAGTGLDIQITHQLKPIVIPEDSVADRTIKALRPGIGIIDLAYATELVKYREYNSSILALGPGDPLFAHRIDERIDVREVAEAAEFYCDICAAITRP